MSYLGFHSEWNLGSPGGWYYQRVVQQIGRWAWEEVQKTAQIPVELDFEHALLDPMPAFAQTLLRAHRKRSGLRDPTTVGECRLNTPLGSGREDPFIVFVAEEETLECVAENRLAVEYLNTLPGVEAVLAAPRDLRCEDSQVRWKDRRVSLVYQDFNNRTIVDLSRELSLEGLKEAIRQGRVVNPRGLEPLGAKGLFEFLTRQEAEGLSETTRRRTPWTRLFGRRATSGPRGEEIPDLVEWARRRWEEVVLKPSHGYSGKGVFVGPCRLKTRDADIRAALEAGDYVLQQLVPLSVWSEPQPFLDEENRRVLLREVQTDFRCFVSDRGLFGFVARFGGIPTNVGSGGGMQAVAVLRSGGSVRAALEAIHQGMQGLGYSALRGIQKTMEEEALRLGLVYLSRPTPMALRPRLVHPEHLEELKEYAENLWNDVVQLEEWWRQGRLENFLCLSKEEEDLARLQPWGGGPAVVSSDGLYQFL